MQVAKRSVGFDGTPAKVAVTVDYVPVFIRDATALSAYPASIAIFEKASVGKDDGVGLISTQRLDDFFEIVDVARAAGSIEPEFDQVAVVRS